MLARARLWSGCETRRVFVDNAFVHRLKRLFEAQGLVIGYDWLSQAGNGKGRLSCFAFVSLRGRWHGLIFLQAEERRAQYFVAPLSFKLSENGLIGCEATLAEYIDFLSTVVSRLTLY